MKLLYVGDIMAQPGIELIEKLVPKLRREHGIDVVFAQAENVSDGKGITLEDYQRLRKTGVDFFSGGNHTFAREEIFPQLNDPAQPIIRPANYVEGTPGLGYKYIDVPKGKVLGISLLGQVVGKDANLVVDNPLQIIDQILESQKDVKRIATIVNFHGDYSSEKVVIGHYLDGRVTAVIGDHWHVPTADARVLPKGTAHITDVGMCGSLDSSLGVKLDTIIERWRDNHSNRNELELSGRMQFNAVLVTVDETTGKALEIEPIQQVIG
jgi:metallophosphoesterase (TIGR00282 family)